MSADPCAGVRQHLTALLDNLMPDGHVENERDATEFVDAHVLPLVEALASASRHVYAAIELEDEKHGDEFGYVTKWTAELKHIEGLLAAARAPKETRDGE